MAEKTYEEQMQELKLRTKYSNKEVENAQKAEREIKTGEVELPEGTRNSIFSLAYSKVKSVFSNETAEEKAKNEKYREKMWKNYGIGDAIEDALDTATAVGAGIALATGVGFVGLGLAAAAKTAGKTLLKEGVKQTSKSFLAKEGRQAGWEYTKSFLKDLVKGKAKETPVKAAEQFAKTAKDTIAKETKSVGDKIIKLREKVNEAGKITGRDFSKAENLIKKSETIAKNTSDKIGKIEQTVAKVKDNPTGVLNTVKNMASMNKRSMLIGGLAGTSAASYGNFLRIGERNENILKNYRKQLTVDKDENMKASDHLIKSKNMSIEERIEKGRKDKFPNSKTKKEIHEQAEDMLSYALKSNNKVKENIEQTQPDLSQMQNQLDEINKNLEKKYKNK